MAQVIPHPSLTKSLRVVVPSPNLLTHPMAEMLLRLRPVDLEHPSKLEQLCKIADELEPGAAVELTQSETATMRIILTAKGFCCATDVKACQTFGKQYVFKLPKY